MPYLVDGNNVMAHIPGWYRDYGKARKRLIFDLVGFVAIHRTKLTVVFDGGSDSDFPDNMLFKGVRIRYARYGSDADERIKELLSGASFKRDIVVVTSDSALRIFASKKGTRVIPSGAFYSRLTSRQSDYDSKPDPDNEKVDVEDWEKFFKTK